MSTRIEQLFQNKKDILSIYFTAGYPAHSDTLPILTSLQAQGVDMVEIGLPFSDPLADGPVIQQSSTQALALGMTTEVLFEQLKDVRSKIDIPLVIMGYFNPVLQFGVAEFCKKCAETGIDAVILPDLPLTVYEREYKAIFESHGIHLIFLITPQTSDERIRALDQASKGFIYLVSTASVTGSGAGFGQAQADYFKRISDMKLQNPIVVGFGIKDRETFAQATAHADGAIIGSAFINALSDQGLEVIPEFVQGIRG
ncbi:MAG: tryptophan synthase subunit alpha [Flavobacteriaceae bacterium]|nr:tryptophan synthase subunit alpha [Flavobacteriaceae bacterium]MDP4795031.1 tryptophan synthase subunit alpha [Flavobacteriaceae bacterium]